MPKKSIGKEKLLVNFGIGRSAKTATRRLNDQKKQDYTPPAFAAIELCSPV